MEVELEPAATPDFCAGTSTAAAAAASIGSSGEETAAAVDEDVVAIGCTTGTSGGG